MLLNIIGGMVLSAVFLVELNAVIGGLAVRPATKLTIIGVVGAWVGLQLALAAAGAFATNFGLTVPLLGLVLALPLLVVATLAWASPTARGLLLDLPTPTLVGLHAARVLGVLFLALAATGRLGGPFPILAGWGDIITGLLAVPLARTLASGSANRSLAALWNALGTLDLIVAAYLAMTSFNGSTLQIIHAGAGSNAVAELPWSLIPSVLVPFYLIMHGVIFAQLRVSTPQQLRAAHL